jgi:NitT/TauT family transport system permease protein
MDLAALTWQTVVPTVSGWVSGCLSAVVLGLIVGSFASTRRAFGFVTPGLRAFPLVALLPFAWWTREDATLIEAVVVACAAFCLVFAATIHGLAAVDPMRIELAEALCLPWEVRLERIVIPSAAHDIALGLRRAAGIALMIAVSTEIIARPAGLGHGIAEAAAARQTAYLLELALWTAVVGTLIDRAFLRLERRMFS